MWFLSFQRRNQPSDGWKFLTFNYLGTVSTFFWIMAADSETFWVPILRNHLRIALSTISKLPVLDFCRLMLLPFSGGSKGFSLLLSQIDNVFFGKAYLAATFLLLLSFSKSLSAWHFSQNILWLYWRFAATNMFKCEQKTKNKQMIVYSNVKNSLH